MGFLVTALKWRPQKFSEIVGQEHISVTLKNAINNQRIAHAYIFTGPRGVGKTTSARIFARSINCMNPQDGEPCNECDICDSFKSGNSLDIIEIDGASNRRIDEIRTLRESVKYAPTKGKYKVYIIDEVHMLTTESFNALLKTLEEPPEHTIFIFATTDIHKVPLTIISRCQRYDFRRIELGTIKSLLAQIADAENIKIDDRSLTLIGKKADGALRDAESLFDQVVAFCGENVDAEVLSQMFNLIDEEIYFRISDAILTKDFSVAFDITQRIYDNGWNFIDFGDGLLEHFRNIMTTVIRKDVKLIEAAEVYHEKYLAYAEKFSEADLLRITSFITKLQYELKQTSNQRLKVEISLCHLIGLEKSTSIKEVLEKLNSGQIIATNSDTEKKNSNSINSSPQLNQMAEEELPAASIGLVNQFKEHQANIKLTDKPDIPQPEEEDSAKSTFQKPLNINPSDYKKTWLQLLEQVQYEKNMLYYPLQHAKVNSFNQNKLDISILKTDEDQIERAKVYINKLVEEYFGKDTITCLTADLNLDRSELDPVIHGHHIEDTELTSAIKEVLGGQEIFSSN